MRRVLESRWHDLGDGVLRYDIRATAFCWQMVRSIVGTLVDVGTGKIASRRPPGHPARRDRAARRPGRAARGPLPLGGRVLRSVVGPPALTRRYAFAPWRARMRRSIRERRQVTARCTPTSSAAARCSAALAEHADEHRRAVFLSLAEAEERHAAHWAERMREAGVDDLKHAALPFRIRVLRRLAATARHRGGAPDRCCAPRRPTPTATATDRRGRRRRWRRRRRCTARSSPPCAAGTPPAGASRRPRAGTAPASAARCGPASSA